MFFLKLERNERGIVVILAVLATLLLGALCLEAEHLLLHLQNELALMRSLHN